MKMPDWKIDVASAVAAGAVVAGAGAAGAVAAAHFAWMEN